MGQMSVMSASLASVIGVELVGEDGARNFFIEVGLSLGIAIGILWLVLSKGYARMQNVMTGLMVAMFVCFLIVAFQGFQEISQILGGLVPSVPADLPATAQHASRSGSGAMIAIIGSAIAPAALLGMPYLAADAGAGPETFKQDFKRAILNLGVIFSAYSFFIIVAGGFALHSLTNFAEIDSVLEAGAVMNAAFPGVMGGIGPIIFSLGLFFAALTTTVAAAQLTSYILLDGVGRDWRFSEDNRAFFRLIVFFLLGPALVAPFWDFPALLKVVLLMGINVVVIPLVIVAVIYLSDRTAVMGPHTSGGLRNTVMLMLLILSLILSATKLPGYIGLF